MSDTFVGIQIGAISFVDEGVEEVLDILQEKAGVNALLISALTWSIGNAGRAAFGFPEAVGDALKERGLILGGDDEHTSGYDWRKFCQEGVSASAGND